MLPFAQPIECRFCACDNGETELRLFHCSARAALFECPQRHLPNATLTSALNFRAKLICSVFLYLFCSIVDSQASVDIFGAVDVYCCGRSRLYSFVCLL